MIVFVVVVILWFVVRIILQYYFWRTFQKITAEFRKTFASLHLQ